MTDEKKAKTWHLREVPEDVRKIIIDEQAKLKRECNCQKSIPATIYSIIRKYAKSTHEL